MKLSGILLPWVSVVCVALLGVGTYGALFVAPADYQQGEAARIMYVHVPAAWMSLATYIFMAVASAMALIFRHPLSDLCAKACAPIGAGFTFLALLTGSLWGGPMWGTFWEWDPRLTSHLILLFIYFGYMAIWSTIEDPTRAARVAAVLALVGSVMVPIIHYSVDWWNSLHQGPSVFREGGPSIHPDMLWPLLVMALGYHAFLIAVLMLRMRTEIIRRRVRALQLRRVGGLA